MNGHVDARNCRLARSWQEQTGQDPEQGGLSRSIGTKHPKDLTRLNTKRDSPKGRQTFAAPKPLDQIDDLEHEGR